MHGKKLISSGKKGSVNRRKSYRETSCRRKFEVIMSSVNFEGELLQEKLKQRFVEQENFKTAFRTSFVFFCGFDVLKLVCSITWINFLQIVLN